LIVVAVVDVADDEHCEIKIDDMDQCSHRYDSYWYYFHHYCHHYCRHYLDVDVVVVFEE